MGKRFTLRGGVLGAAAFASCCSAFPQTEQQVQGVLESARVVQSHEQMRQSTLDELRKNRAVARFASEQSGHTTNVDQLLSSPAAKQIIRDTQNIAQSTSAQATQLAQLKEPGQASTLIDKAAHQAKSAGAVVSLSPVTTWAETLKNGHHNVLSPGGEELVQLMRVSAAGTKDSRAALESIKASNTPEAWTFLGWLSENGALGAPKDVGAALRLYSKAAAAGYQPAIYNLALASLYGRAGASNLNAAMRYADQAFGVAVDKSGRVCGLASYLSHKLGQKSRALTYAEECNSALASMAQGFYDNRLSFEKRMSYLRESLYTGADDGYAGLLNISKALYPQANADKAQFICKYNVLFQSATAQPSDLLGFAKNCLVARTATGDKSIEASALQMRAKEIVGFVNYERSHVAEMRKANRFHYSLSVPYLPFAQQEVNHFSKAIAL